MAAHSPSTEHIADSSVFRAALRREKLAARMALDEQTHLALSSRIEEHLSQLLSPMPPRTLGFCTPIRGEFDARPLVSRLIDLGWQAAMPVVEMPDTPMTFRHWVPASTMAADRHGIPVPSEGAVVRPDIVLLPLVAFDTQGFRLGYGGGYFDRTLAALIPRPFSIGIGFELGRVADIRPQLHDLRLDSTVTENGVVCHEESVASDHPETAGLASTTFSVNHDTGKEPS